MRKERQKAKELRAAGKSYTEIGKKFGIPKSTLSSWFAHEEWSQAIRRKRTAQAAQEAKVRVRQLPQAVRQYWQNIRNQHRVDAARDFLELSKQAIFLAGIVLYWTKGDTSPENSQVRFTSSDPEMIKAFYTFLDVNKLVPKTKIKMRLLLYPDLIDSVQRSTWSKLLGIPSDSFQKSIIIKRMKKMKRFSSGSCMILIHSRALKEKLLKWIELYQGLLYTAKT
ncbi:MAG: hypothetical protein A3A33_04180 [Candidatus Yanofskybacteria bacterium RIFCSPLOWO2_01_FULL_49_25]|uniref:HTH psq-type domain-containing protein n=1 Tax=Candidatus Yanofskybacteria bacterium RIFCSPLOWO2_01_FULL_49_25 TaxID=1802701 RepID=A0A1F8GR60_9BACT|nr:MAG: hypothetical protein A3A33_04180 [Candidatus Yanofskybacteria bacterium RIFCSPLOWO2_01_FULL_49_25]